MGRTRSRFIKIGVLVLTSLVIFVILARLIPVSSREGYSDGTNLDMSESIKGCDVFGDIETKEFRYSILLGDSNTYENLDELYRNALCGGYEIHKLYVL